MKSQIRTVDGKTRTLLGTGALTWNRGERVSDRYGMVYCADSNSEGKTINRTAKMHLEAIKSVAGQKGRLIAVVLKTRQSTHIGDLFRGISPVTPEVGEEIVLGEGKFVHEKNEYADDEKVGLSPEDGRENDWLIPQKLYRAHEQDVNLFFETL
jgi:hypothetical protein